MGAERITPAMVTSATLADINSALKALDRSGEELSSGKTIFQPSDNPFGTSQVIDLQSQLEGLSAYASNAQDGVSWQNTASSAMSSINQVLQRVRELLIQTSNGTFNESVRKTIAAEVNQLTEAVKQDASTQYNGQYVFSGTATTTAPYQPGENDEYKGNNAAITRSVAPGASVTISTDISSLLGNGPASEDGKLLDVLRTISTNLSEGTAKGVEALATTDLKNLDANIETLSKLQATAGTSIDQMQAAITRNESLQAAVTKNLSNTEDANIAEVSIAYSNEQAAYEAALRAGAKIVQESLLNFLQ